MSVERIANREKHRERRRMSVERKGRSIVEGKRGPIGLTWSSSALRPIRSTLTRLLFLCAPRYSLYALFWKI